MEGYQLAITSVSYRAYLSLEHILRFRQERALHSYTKCYIYFKRYAIKKITYPFKRPHFHTATLPNFHTAKLPHCHTSKLPHCHTSTSTSKDEIKFEYWNVIYAFHKMFLLIMQLHIINLGKIWWRRLWSCTCRSNLYHGQQFLRFDSLHVKPLFGGSKSTATDNRKGFCYMMSHNFMYCLGPHVLSWLRNWHCPACIYKM